MELTSGDLAELKPVWDKNEYIYRYEYKGMPQSIYRDSESGWWLDAERSIKSGTHTTQPLYLGSTKKEAIKKTIELTNEALKELGF